jgi:hypothetical protein
MCCVPSCGAQQRARDASKQVAFSISVKKRGAGHPGAPLCCGGGIRDDSTRIPGGNRYPWSASIAVEVHRIVAGAIGRGAAPVVVGRQVEASRLVRYAMIAFMALAPNDFWRAGRGRQGAAPDGQARSWPLARGGPRSERKRSTAGITAPGPCARRNGRRGRPFARPRA